MFPLYFQSIFHFPVPLQKTNVPFEKMDTKPLVLALINLAGLLKHNNTNIK